MFQINNNLASSFEGLDKLLEVYDQLDASIMHFKRAAGLDCAAYCRECCGTPAENVEASIFEVLPLSIYLWQKGEAEYWLQKIRQSDAQSPCVLYNPDPSLQPESGCSVYMWRPLVCRLFGFSAMLNKHGKPVVMLCKYMKRLDPGLERRIQSMIDRGLNIPINSYYAQKISLINPSLGQIRYPINEALRRALEIVGFRMALTNQNRGDHFDNTPGKPPKRPPIKKSA